MLTRIGGNSSSSVPGGKTGAGDQVEAGLRISKPGCKGRWNSSVSEPGMPRLAGAFVSSQLVRDGKLTIVAMRTSTDIYSGIIVEGTCGEGRILLVVNTQTLPTS